MDSLTISKLDISAQAEDLGAIWYKQLANGERAFVVPLVFHVGLYIYQKDSQDFKDRFCMFNLVLAKEAVDEYEKTGVMRFWQKHHNQNISVVGNKAYPSGELEIEQHVLYEVDWDTQIISDTYEPYINLSFL